MSRGGLVPAQPSGGVDDRLPPGRRPTPVLDVPLDRRLLLVPLLTGVALCAVSVAWQTAEGRGWQPVSQQLDRVLDVDEDLSVLNWLSASVFLVAALVAAVVAGRVRGSGRGWWWLLAVGVLAVSVDEAAGVSDPVRVALATAAEAGGPPRFAAGVAAVLTLAVALGVLRVLPAHARWRVVLAGVLLLAAAVGVDSLGPDLADRPEDRLQTWYVLKATVEEAVELVAAVLLLDAMVLAASTADDRGSMPRSGGEHTSREALQQDEPQGHGADHDQPA